MAFRLRPFAGRSLWTGRKSARTRPPGPRGVAVAGFFSGRSFSRTLEFLRRQSERYGPIVHFRIGGRSLYLLDDPGLVREVLVVQQHRFARATGAALLREIVGASLVTVEEPLHRMRRRMLQPAFHRRAIAAYGVVMAQEARRIEAVVDRAAATGEAIDIGALMARLTLAVTARTLFGSDVGDRAGAMTRALAPAMITLSRLGPIFEVLPPGLAAVLRRLPLPGKREFAAARAELQGIVGSLVRERRAEREPVIAREPDLLDLVLAARDDDGVAFDDVAVADELATLVLAGHETTATALTWTWYLLARHPEVADRLAEECVAVCGDRDVSADDVTRLTYAAAVFSEALRLYPPASAFGRRVLEACVLAGYRVPRGAGIVISPYVIHRNPRWFPEPDAFRPERWQTADWPEFAFVPFGGGAKRCIGESFARLEAVIAIATLARAVRFVAVDAGPAHIASATLRPERPILLLAEPRVLPKRGPNGAGANATRSPSTRP